MEVVVLAGGKGTRLASAVADVPKPMAPVDGRPFLEYLFDFWAAHGASAFLLSTGYRSGVFERHFGQVYKGIPVHYAAEPSPLGTGGGLAFAVRAFKPKKDFWICNGDTLLDFSPAEMRQFHLSHGADLTAAAVPPPAEKRYGGLWLDEEGRMTRFRNEATDDTVNGGVYLANPALFAQETSGDRPASLESDFFPRWTQQGKRLYGFRTPGPFLDIGVPESYARAGDFLNRFASKRTV